MTASEWDDSGAPGPVPQGDYPAAAGLTAPNKIANWRPLVHWLLVIPHLVVVYVLSIAAGVLLLVAWFAALFTTKVPDGIATFLAGFLRYQWRVNSYMFYLRESYPSFSLPSGYADPGGDPAWLQIVPPPRLSRLQVFFRFLLIIPQALFGIVLSIAVYLVMIIVFFAVLFTGRWPEGLRGFVLGVFNWSARVNAWHYLLVDPYPPFQVAPAQ